MTPPLPITVGPRPPGPYLVFDGCPDLNPAALRGLELVAGEPVDAEPAWREHGTGTWSLGPLDAASFVRLGRFREADR